MVPFAGYELPVQYPTGVIKEHLACRSSAALFDVSHMGQARLSGANAVATLESLMPSNLDDLAIGRQRYGVLTNEGGGIIDDLIVTNNGDHLSIVYNAARRSADLQLLRQHLLDGVELDVLDDRALLALQGPRAVDVLSPFAPDSAALTFLQASSMTLLGYPCQVSRSGYTGEDGFEISIANRHAEALARELLTSPEVVPAGLGARDTLRLEAGLCLYGHDLDEHTTPVEAGLEWVVSHSRRRVASMKEASRGRRPSRCR